MSYEPIQADYVDIKFIKNRSTWKIVFEVDETMGQAIIDRLGLPSSGESKPCAIVRLDTGNS